MEASAQGPRVYDLNGIDRTQLTNRAGVKYLEFRRTLTPRYGVVWAQLLGGYAALVAIGAAIVALNGTRFGSGGAVVGGALLGYVVAYLQLFFHEATHYNIAKRPWTNDRMANLLIGSMVGQEVKAYRLVHFGHHRYLGTPSDTERTYSDPLNLPFLP